MNTLQQGTPDYHLLPPELLPPGSDERQLRDLCAPKPVGGWRNLRPEEIDTLRRNGNRADSWNNVLVSAAFDPDQVRNSEFCGPVRIGSLGKKILDIDGFLLPTGISDSRIISCDIGDDVAIHQVRFLAHCTIGNRCLLFDIGEVRTTKFAKFGNGIVRKGEEESARPWLDIMNEPGGRRVAAFDGMIAADSWLQANFREDAPFQRKLVELTQNRFDPAAIYGSIGDDCVIKHVRTLEDARIGPSCFITGAEKIADATIRSIAEEPVTVGEGAVIESAIIGRGCSVLHGARVVSSVVGDNTRIEHGLRLVHTVLGENSTLAGAEVQHSLIFAAHEQHHSSSFLIAALVMGQSNSAAGSIVGSNHNSRSVDGELRAGRGFWPGLCASVKHSSRFASYVLLSKGDYNAELDIPLPFCLVTTRHDRLELMPAYWWLYNMYALARNPRKFAARDKRKSGAQHLEFDYLAPDTVEEIFEARRLLELWTGRAASKSTRGEEELIRSGRELLTSGKAKSLRILAEGVEKSHRPAEVTKAVEGYAAYGDMIRYYAVKTILAHLADYPEETVEGLFARLAGERRREWTNLGGQIVPTAEVELLRSGIKSGTLDSWDKVHALYDLLWDAYPQEKLLHATATLRDLLGTDTISAGQWQGVVEDAVRIQQFVADQVFLTRKKDDDNPFRRATYRSVEEMHAVVPPAGENEFVRSVKEESEEFRKRAGK